MVYNGDMIKLNFVKLLVFILEYLLLTPFLLYILFNFFGYLNVNPFLSLTRSNTPLVKFIFSDLISIFVGLPLIGLFVNLVFNFFLVILNKPTISETVTQIFGVKYNNVKILDRLAYLFGKYFLISIIYIVLIGVFIIFSTK